MKRSRRRYNRKPSESSESDAEEKKRRLSETDESTVTSADKEAAENEEKSEPESIPKEKITLKINKSRIQPPREEDDDEDDEESSNDNVSSKNGNSCSDALDDGDDDEKKATNSKHISRHEENGVSEEMNGQNGKEELVKEVDVEEEEEDKENTEKQENGTKSDVDEPRRPMIRLVPLTNLLKSPIKHKTVEDVVVCLSSDSEDCSKKSSASSKRKNQKIDSSSEDEIIKPSKKKMTKVANNLVEKSVVVNKTTATKPLEAMTNDEILQTYFTMKCKVKVKKDDLSALATKHLAKSKMLDERRNKPGPSRAVSLFF